MNLTCEFSSGDTRDLLCFIIFISEIIYINIFHKKSFLSWNLIERFFRCLTKTIRSIPHFYRYYLRTIAILLFRFPIFNSFIRIPRQFWKRHH
jgi:hypothetical protein